MKPRYILPVMMAAALSASCLASDLVILHTNDTHSQIDPTDKGLGGIQRRKALIDSIRATNENVLLVDAGDAVQGTLFFTLYGGEVEMKMLDALGYDVAILGNHDFDNGMEALKKNVTSTSSPAWLSTNYKFSDPELAEVFSPYRIYEFDGKKIGVIAINLNPKGMIAEGNYDGVTYLDGMEAANSTAWVLKNLMGADAVVAVTHIGYDEVPPSDRDIAASSDNIDVILGGHSHTDIMPGSGQEWVNNRNGRPVLITQNGKSGLAATQVTIDLDSIGTKLPVFTKIPIDKSLDRRRDPRIDSIIAPYRKGVDDLMGVKIGRTAKAMEPTDPALLNFVSDFLRERGKKLMNGTMPDLSLANKGSLRRSLPKGVITQGEIISMQPFANRVVVIKVKGSDLIEAFEVMARRDGDGVSSNVDATFDRGSHTLKSLRIDGKPVDPDRYYTVATIDYLANGGDYMEPLTRGTREATSETIVYNDLIDYIKSLRDKPINPSDKVRMRPAD